MTIISIENKENKTTNFQSVAFERTTSEVSKEITTKKINSEVAKSSKKMDFNKVSGIEGSCMVEPLEINSCVFELKEEIKTDTILNGGLNVLEIKETQEETFETACVHEGNINALVEVASFSGEHTHSSSICSLDPATNLSKVPKFRFGKNGNVDLSRIVVNETIMIANGRVVPKEFSEVSGNGEESYIIIIIRESTLEKRFMTYFQVHCVNSSFALTKGIDCLLEKMQNASLVLFTKKKRELGINAIEDNNAYQTLNISNFVDPRNWQFKKNVLSKIEEKKEAPMIEKSKENEKKIKMAKIGTNEPKNLSLFEKEKEEDFAFTLLMLIMFGVPFVLIFLIFHFVRNSMEYWVNPGKMKKRLQLRKKYQQKKHEIVLYPCVESNYLVKKQIMQIENQANLMLLMMQVFVHLAKEERILVIESLERVSFFKKKEILFCIIMQIKNKDN